MYAQFHKHNQRAEWQHWYSGGKKKSHYCSWAMEKQSAAHITQKCPPPPQQPTGTQSLIPPSSKQYAAVCCRILLMTKKKSSAGQLHLPESWGYYGALPFRSCVHTAGRAVSLCTCFMYFKLQYHHCSWTLKCLISFILIWISVVRSWGQTATVSVLYMDFQSFVTHLADTKQCKTGNE